MKLIDDFIDWWEMPKYAGVDIPAKQYSEVEIVSRHGSNRGWPGAETDVDYWVELENGIAVGIITPKKGMASFPVYPLRKEKLSSLNIHGKNKSVCKWVIDNIENNPIYDYYKDQPGIIQWVEDSKDRLAEKIDYSTP